MDRAKTNSFFLQKSAHEPEIGFTTGTCACAASIAASRMLLTGMSVPYVILSTPKGIKVCIEIENQQINGDSASCSVTKFSGTDPDVTNGIKVFSTVKKIVTNNQRRDDDAETIVIKGGEGVGTVTLPGLNQNVGEAAINSVPRKMITEGVKAELKKSGMNLPLEITISVPGGEEIAQRTFNPKLGITGGISILGTSGIVEPMSEQALLDTIQVEMNVRKAQGFDVLVMVPGNYGSEFLEKEYGFSLETAVHCSNFVYDAVQMAVSTGFKKMLFCGHCGKLVKVAGGIKNTHSKYGDHRMEIILSVAKKYLPQAESTGIEKELTACISTEQAVKILESYGLRECVMQEITSRIQNQMTEWTSNLLQVEVITFTNSDGLLGETKNARTFIECIK